VRRPHPRGPLTQPHLVVTSPSSRSHRNATGVHHLHALTGDSSENLTLAGESFSLFIPTIASRSNEPDQVTYAKWYRAIRSVQSPLDPTIHRCDPNESVPMNHKPPRVEPGSILVQIRFKSISNHLQLAKIISFDS
jgi:hypothetical protein